MGWTGRGTMLAGMEPLDPLQLLDPLAAARYLLGAVIRRQLDSGEVLEAMIVEAEAYFQADPASHTHRGPTARNAAMFGPPGHAYVYLSYGVHWCLNVTAGRAGEGAGVLIRAAEPLWGLERMQELRGRPDRQPLSGPGRLGQGLAIDSSLYGHDLSRPPLQVLGGGRVPPDEVTLSTRIGISKAKNALLRVFITGSPAVSRR